jgi:hypothetical protein
MATHEKAQLSPLFGTALRRARQLTRMTADGSTDRRRTYIPHLSVRLEPAWSGLPALVERPGSELAYPQLRPVTKP